MRLSIPAGTLTFLSLAGSVLGLGRQWTLSNSVIGEQFYDFFEFEAIADPTNGRVNYVDQQTAVNDGLTWAEADTFLLRADSWTTLSASGPGRNSFRIKSYDSFYQHVAIFDIEHMPVGCGTWPAVWETNESNWPDGGEVDIIEGVNDVSPNLSSLHTSPDCSMPSSRTQSGTAGSNDCDATVNGNSGCQVSYTEDYNSFGPNFNSVQGGWYAIQRENSFIKIWFWERGDSSAPSDVTSGASTVNPQNWGEAAAYFPDTDCDLESHFDANNIIINLTFCGDWAGSSSAYSSAGCPSDCVDYVNNNPSAFSDAFFIFKGLRIYTNQ